MSRTLLLNVVDREERRALLLENGRPSLFWLERDADDSIVGNIYLGCVTHVEPAIGAAFVDIGQERPSFLHVDDVMPTYAAGGDGPADFAPRPAPGERARIEDHLAKGQTVLVQVARDAIRHKGPSLTTHISLAARTVVLLPSLGRVGVSRRIEDDDLREQLRQTVARLPVPEGMGLVVRTTAATADPDELERELGELLDDLDRVRDLATTRDAPSLLRPESRFVERAIRDLFGRTVEGDEGATLIVTDTADAAERARAAVAGVSGSPQVELHEGDVPLFHAHRVEDEIRKLASPKVALPGGASVVIQETEALWAIDVNSGRMREGANLEETALETDLAAAHEVARQIRLRDLGGLIVVDFIDCRDPENRGRIESTLRTELAKDPARLRVAPMSEFMVLEITRRRLRRGPARTGSSPCRVCVGTGHVRSPAATGLAALRDLRACLAAGAADGVTIECSRAVARDLETRGAELDGLEDRYDVEIRLVERRGFGVGEYRLVRD